MILNTKTKVSKRNSSAKKSDPHTAYRSLVSMSSSRFRADVEFHEEPRQVIFAGVLLCLLFALSIYSSNSVETAAGVYKISALAACSSLVVYTMLQSKDGLMIRPHPMIWRAVHGVTLCYYCIIVLLVVLPPSYGIYLFHEIFPEANGGPEVVARILEAGIIPVGPLDCTINGETVWRQFASIWFAAHAVGFWAKMCLYRDWSICITYSIAFEVAELSLGWLIPEFQECWWDSIFMDVLGANLLGMFLGHLTLKWLSCRKYDWEPENKNSSLFANIRHACKRLTPFSWAPYVWPKDGEYSWLPSIGWISALCIELNSFILIHALHVNPAHWTNPLRQLLLAAQGAQAVPEWYEYVRGNVSRIGHNCWLLYMTTAFEILLGMRYGRGGRSYGPFAVPVDIVVILSSFSILWVVWLVVSARRSKRGKRIAPYWLTSLRVFAYIPLLFLAFRWAY